MKSIPCCEFPTTTVFIDDSEDLAAALRLNLSFEKSRYQFFTDPCEGLSHLQKYRSLFAKNVVSLQNNGSLFEPQVQFKLSDLERHAHYSSRFREISTIVVDYQMPHMNGLELLEQIKLPHVEKILLTGVADENIGVEAFERRLIHSYIRKHDRDLPRKLNQGIKNGQERFFERVTQFVNRAVSCENGSTALNDPRFQEIFWKIKEKLGAVEHYLWDSMGGFLFLDQHACAVRLFTFTEEQLQYLAESEEAQALPPDVLRKIATGELILCYPNTTGALPPGELWVKYLRKPLVIKGRQNYYCAFVSEAANEKVGQIVPFTRKSASPCLTTMSEYAYL